MGGELEKNTIWKKTHVIFKTYTNTIQNDAVNLSTWENLKTAKTKVSDKLKQIDAKINVI